jgi:hypothetical protein
LAIFGAVFCFIGFGVDSFPFVFSANNFDFDPDALEGFTTAANFPSGLTPGGQHHPFQPW